nr:choice-of-anchor D domain-containing protein [Planctomycetota bacterium]
MSRCRSIPCLLSLTAALGGGSAALAGGQWTIVATYDVPEGASGLAYDGTWLYCGIYGPDGGRVYQINPSTGASSLLFTGPHEDAYGLTYDGQNLWTTDHPGSSSTPAIAMKLDWDGTLLDQVDLPAHYVSGITYDAGDLWVARYYEDPAHLFKIDGAGTVLRDFQAPDDQPWDLCLENGDLWVADYWGDTLYKVSASTGALLESHPSEGVDPAGVVWDGTHLWYCDNGAGGVDFLYKVDLSGAGTPEISVPVSTHDYGLVSIGQAPTWNVTVFNTGDAPLEISGVTFTPPADLFSSASFPITVPMGGNVQIPIVFAPTTFGPLDATATIASDDPVHPAEDLDLTGHAVFAEATIDILDDTHAYGSVRKNAHTRWFMEVANHGNEVLTIDDLVVADPRFYVEPGLAVPFDLAPLETAQVGVWFNPVAATPYAATLDVHSSGPADAITPVSLGGSGLDIPYPMGDVLWTYTIDTSFDNTPKAFEWIPDVSGDGIADVIICSEDDFVRCFNGNASGTGDVLWEHEIPGGSVYQQHAIQIVPDIDEDGEHDVVVGAAWGGKLVRAISGATGDEIWTFNTNVWGDGGWVYQVDGTYDYNGDGTIDVLACAGDDSTDTGPKRAFCLNGLSGVLIWNRPLNGPVFSVIGIEDFTGDGLPDVLAGASNESETQGRAVGLDGTDGGLEWTFLVASSSVWALAQAGDITSDGVSDVVIADFSGNVYGLNAVTGTQEYTFDLLGTTTRLEVFDDIDDDGHVEVLGSHFSTYARMIGTRTGSTEWTTALVDKPAAVARIPDITGDATNDVVLGTLFSNNRAYFIDGVTGGVLHSFDYGTPIDGIRAIPDISGDGSWEMIIGGRNGLVTVASGGLAVPGNPADVNGDGVVNFGDILAIIGAWGPCPGCPADVNGDGMVNFADILLVIASWTP